MAKCPMCGSEEIEETMLEGIWKCKECGYPSDWGDFLVD